MNYNNWIGGMPDPSFLDTDSIHLDDLFIQSQALKNEAGTKSKVAIFIQETLFTFVQDDDSGISTGLNSDAGASSPESATYADTTPLLSIKQEATDSLQMGMPLPTLSSPETAQLSDSYYSNHSSSPETERTGSKKTAYNEKWGVKVLKGKHTTSWSHSFLITEMRDTPHGELLLVEILIDKIDVTALNVSSISFVLLELDFSVYGLTCFRYLFSMTRLLMSGRQARQTSEINRPFRPLDFGHSLINKNSWASSPSVTHRFEVKPRLRGWLCQPSG